MESIERDYEDLYLKAGQVFQPATPIKTRELFAGRLNEIARVADAVGNEGLHVAIYGERGVGKTSLANVIAELSFGLAARSVRVNCDTTDTFGSVWNKLARRTPTAARDAGFGTDDELPTYVFSEEPTPDDAVRFLESQPRPLVCIFDEFDRVPQSAALVFSDLIKTLSDNSDPSTIILVGVAETVTDLVHEHRSIERALVQVEMPRMENGELEEILDKAAAQLGVTFTDNAKQAIVRLSQGLPHYTHLLGRESVRMAAGDHHRNIAMKTVREGIKAAIETAQETIRDDYFQAVQSARQDALYGEVLLACALARKGDRSSFRASDVTKPMSKIMKKPYNIPAIAKHLKAFCEDPDRAKILTRSGKKRNFVYRFHNPLMESYVLMRGLAEEKITSDQLQDLGR